MIFSSGSGRTLENPSMSNKTSQEANKIGGEYIVNYTYGTSKINENIVNR